MVKPKQILDFQKFTENSMVLSVLETLESKGFEVYIAGGAVRDMLLGRQPYDFDVATNARPKEVKLIFPKHTTRGEAFGTIAVQVGADQVFEITTYRSEDVYTNSRHPDQIRFSDSILQDSLRRDFTINAMYADRRGYILDPQNGLKALEQKILKTVGQAEERFQEDALRVLRAFRFVSQLGFSLRPEEQDAAIAAWSSLSKVSSERVYVEVKKMIAGEYFFKVFPVFLNFNLFEYFVESDIYKTSKFTKENIESYLSQRLKVKSNQSLEEFFLEFAFLKTPQFESYLQAWLSFLPLRKSEKSKIENGIHWFRYLDRISQKYVRSDQPLRAKDYKSDVAKALRLGLEVFELTDLQRFMSQDFLQLFSLHENLIGLALTQLDKLQSVPEKKIQGKDLLAKGVKPGPELRQLINRAFEWQLLEPHLDQEELFDKLGLASKF